MENRIKEFAKFQELPIRQETKDLILIGRPKGQRSEAMMKVLNALVHAGLSDNEICQIFEQQPIGEKYREKGHFRRGWLVPQIEKARAYVSVSSIPSEAPEQATLSFPSEVMSGQAGRFAVLYSTYLESPPHFFFMSFLTCLGAILSGKLRLNSELDVQPRLYTVLLGESADDRKSTAITKTVRLFLDAIIDFFECYGVGSAEGLMNSFKEHRNQILVLDEFQQFVSKASIQSSVLLPMANTLFESNQYENRTKDKVTRVEDAHLSILTASTMDTYERMWKPNFRDIGFNNRLFIVPGSGQRRFSIPHKIPNTETDALKRDLSILVASSRQCVLGLIPGVHPSG